MDDQIKVYSIWVDGTPRYTSSDMSDILDEISNWLVDINDAPNQTTEFKIVQSWMTRAEIDAMPEFDGW